MKELLYHSNWFVCPLLRLSAFILNDLCHEFFLARSDSVMFFTIGADIIKSHITCTLPLSYILATRSITGKEVKLFQKLVSLIKSISTLLITGQVQNVTSRHLVKRSEVEKNLDIASPTSMSSSSTCVAKSGGLAAPAMWESLTWWWRKGVSVRQLTLGGKKGVFD